MSGLLRGLSMLAGASMPTADDLNDLGAQWRAFREEQQAQTVLLRQILAELRQGNMKGSPDA